MGFYDLPKDQRQKLTAKITLDVNNDLLNNSTRHILQYFTDEDTYIRKTAYLAFGKLYKSNQELEPAMINTLNRLLQADDHKVRQTTINAAGEIGIYNFQLVQPFFDQGLFDTHHSVRNAVIGSLKKMGEKNPKPTLAWAQKYLHHEDKEIRREICHGIELRGRTHPEDILPLLEQLQHDKTARVRNTLVHVIGQISYKKGCLETVISVLNDWEDRELVKKALDEIVDVHERYKNFAILTQEQVITYINDHYKHSNC